MENGAAPARCPVPLRRRPVDWILLAFFAVNLFFITYFVDIEQLTIANPVHFSYPAWPPHAIVNMVHSYGQKYDPLLMARPAFWRMTIWIDVLWNGPFYVAAIYAISRGREWIRVPALIWSGSMSAVVLIILAEEYNGIHATPHFPIVRQREPGNVEQQHDREMRGRVDSVVFLGQDDQHDGAHRAGPDQSRNADPLATAADCINRGHVERPVPQHVDPDSHAPERWPGHEQRV